MIRTVAMFLLAVALPLHAETEAKPDRKPNIVYILADDLGYGDVGCYNSESKIPTPNLDRLASGGLRCTDAHSPASVCSPTRYALLTGRYAWRSPLKSQVIRPWDKPIISPGRLTVPSLLRQHGYVTAAIGKWHLGWTWTTNDGKPASNDDQGRNNVDFLKPIANGPLAHGFDHYFGVDVPNYPPYCFIEDDRTVGVPSGPDGGRDEGFNMPGPMIPGWRLVDILPELTRHAERWIEDTAKSEKPFFLYLPLTSPHYPVVPSPEFIGKSKAGEYGDFVYQTDWVVGRVLDALEKADVADNTLLIFTSDNGPEITGEVDPGAYDRIRKFQHTSMGKLRGAKRDLWEGGHRVPFIARWPGRIAAGSTSDETICHVDLLATVAAQLGVSLPPDSGEDSYNILPVLLGEKRTGAIREATVHHSASGTFAIRKGDWVFIQAPSGDDNRKNGEPEWFRQMRGYGSDKSELGLFNLRDDPSQKNNLAAEHPSRVLELRELLAKYQREGRSTPGAPQANDAPMQRSTSLPRFRGKVKKPGK